MNVGWLSEDECFIALQLYLKLHNWGEKRKLSGGRYAMTWEVALIHHERWLVATRVLWIDSLNLIKKKTWERCEENNWEANYQLWKRRHLWHQLTDALPQVPHLVFHLQLKWQHLQKSSYLKHKQLCKTWTYRQCQMSRQSRHWQLLSQLGQLVSWWSPSNHQKFQWHGALKRYQPPQKMPVFPIRIEIICQSQNWGIEIPTQWLWLEESES